jgi:hypothetical protein
VPYVEKLRTVDYDLERLQRELEQASDVPGRKRITAVIIVLRRQRRWYSRRNPPP